VPEENLLDFYGAREDNRGRHTDHPAERHSIQTNQRPPPTAPIFMPDALPAITVPLYPGLGQAPNMWRAYCRDSYAVAWFPSHKWGKRFAK